MSTLVELGTEVENFTLKDQHNEDLSLSDLKGKNILLLFHPLAWTQICSEEMNRIDVRMDLFEKLNTVPLGISVDTVPSKKAWAKEIGVERMRLLSDFWPHGEVSRQLGVFREADGFSERAIFLLNEKHEVIYAKTFELAEQPDLKEVEELLADYEKASFDLDEEIKKCLRDNSGKLICMEDLEAVGIHTTPKVSFD